MRVLYICGTYCPSHGGAELSMHTLLKYLQNNYRIKVLVVSDFRYTKNKKENHYDGLKIIGTSHEYRKKTIQKIIKKFKPSLMITQLMWSDIALELGKKESIPTILRVCKIPFDFDVDVTSEYSPTSIMAVSRAVKKYVEKKYHRDCKIIFPAIDLNKVLIPKEYFCKPFGRKYITMFNPLIRKGGHMFKKIAKTFQNKNFGVVYGWSSLKDSTKSREFSDKLIKRIHESLGTKFTHKKPEYIYLDHCHNIHVFKTTEDVWKIYSRTQILLVPSQWEEPFPRVVIEGMANGIPTIASNVGGIKDAIGRGGILVKDYKNTKAWIEKIKKLENRKYYTKISKREIEWIRRNYSLNKIIKNSFNFFTELVDTYKK